MSRIEYSTFLEFKSTQVKSTVVCLLKFRADYAFLEGYIQVELRQFLQNFI